MRYVKLKTVITKAVDETIDEIEYVQKIMESLRSKEMNCTIRLTDGPKQSPIRIKECQENTFRYTLIGHSSSLTKIAHYDEIDYLEVNTQDTIMAEKKPNVSRWSLLDPSSSFGDE